MQNVLLGNKKGLVFPVMCNGVVKIPYESNIVDISDDDDTTNDVPYGLWGHTNSFSFDAVITPYEINGNGDGSITDSSKTFPNGGSFSTRNLTTTSRLTHNP